MDGPRQRQARYLYLIEYEGMVVQIRPGKGRARVRTPRPSGMHAMCEWLAGGAIEWITVGAPASETKIGLSDA
jgi:hypothetical protein